MTFGEYMLVMAMVGMFFIFVAGLAIGMEIGDNIKRRRG